MDIVDELLAEHANDQKWMAEYKQAKCQMLVGLAIREKRLDHQLSQRQLAHQAGIRRAVLARIENGDANPSLKVLGKIADALNTELTISFN